MHQTPPITLFLHGLASGKKIPLPLSSQLNLQLTLLDFLRMNSIPVASSCDGVGVCKKCVINKNLLACQITLKQLYQDPSLLSHDAEKDYYFIEIAYL